MNEKALASLPLILKKMHSASRNAPVFRVEEATFGDPFRMLVFTMLSSRTKDDTTLLAVRRLFMIADTPEKISKLKKGELEKILYGVGFYRMKANHLIELCRALLRNFGGEVPSSLEALLMLPGVGRKTANIVLARAFGKKTLGVDVHVNRISNRLGLVKTKKPEQTEKAMVKIVPARLLPEINREFVAFGQSVCLPRKPRCGSCPIYGFCWRVGVKYP